MSRTPESSPPRSRLPIGFAGFGLLTAALVAPIAAQGPDRVVATAQFAKEPGGTVLGQLAKGAAVTFGARRDGWREVSLEGWVAAADLRDDGREGFDVSIAPGDGAEVRIAPQADASVRAIARVGALFHRVERRQGWVRVRRTGWIEVPSATPPADSGKVVAAVPPTGAGDSTVTSLIGGSDLSARPDGPPIGRIEATRPVTVLERRDGWTRVRLDGWVRDAAVGNTPPPDQISAAEIRADPERYVGQTVEWSLQVLALQQADELRPELPLGQPYVLARGPLPETGFVYLVVQGDQVDAFRKLEPLTEVRVRATVRAGRTRFLPVPVLDLVRRLD